MKEFNLVVRDSSGQVDVIVLRYLTEHASAKEAIAAARRAVTNYLKTDAGRRDYDINGGDFNWGDVINCVPDVFFIAEGLMPYNPCPSFECEVEHDEDLVGTLYIDEKGTPEPPNATDGAKSAGAASDAGKSKPFGTKRARYELFKMLWLMSHGYTLKDLVCAVLRYRAECAEEMKDDPDGLDVLDQNIFADWECEIGFDGAQIWPCFEEFLEDDDAEIDWSHFIGSIKAMAERCGDNEKEDNE